MVWGKKDPFVEGGGLGKKEEFIFPGGGRNFVLKKKKKGLFLEKPRKKGRGMVAADGKKGRRV